MFKNSNVVNLVYVVLGILVTLSFKLFLQSVASFWC